MMSGSSDLWQLMFFVCRAAKYILDSNVPTRRWVLERFIAWAVRANLVLPFTLSAVEKNSLRSTKQLKPENFPVQKTAWLACRNLIFSLKILK